MAPGWVNHSQHLDLISLQVLLIPNMASSTLPSDALKAILIFMTRQELMDLAEVNRQFYSVINSPPLITKPLLLNTQLYLRYNGNGTSMEGTLMWNSIYCLQLHGIDDVASLLEKEWLRISERKSSLLWTNLGTYRVPYTTQLGPTGLNYDPQALLDLKEPVPIPLGGG